MAGLFEKQAAIYAEARPKYPQHWFSKFASLTSHHHLAWDVGTGNGQAAIGVAEHYDQVVATDVSEAQLKHGGAPHPKVRYIHTPLSTSDDEFVSMLGGEGSVDLVTVAEAVHWFDLPRFYSLVKRVLRKPGGVIAVWGYSYRMSDVEHIVSCLHESLLPYWDPRAWYVIDGYRDLPFPFKSVGLGSEGEPASLEMVQDMSFQGFLSGLRSSSVVAAAKEKGVDLLSEEVINELETDWGGGSSGVRRITYKAFMLAGTPAACSLN